jgi:hypothetical protein
VNMTDPRITEIERYGEPSALRPFLDDFGNFVKRRDRQEMEQAAEDAEWETRHEKEMFE